MTNDKYERVFLEAQLGWVKQRDALLKEIENKLYEMKHIAEQVASSGDFILESEKYQLNKKFLHLKTEIAELESRLDIQYN